MTTFSAAHIRHLLFPFSIVSLVAAKSIEQGSVNLDAFQQA